MTKIGEYPLQRSDGAYDDVELYELGTFDQDPLLIQLSDGRWGTPYLRPLGDGDTGLLVQKSDGSWLQANKKGILIIEDWESGTRDTDTWNWENTDFTGEMLVTTGSSYDGTYGLVIDAFARTIAMPGYPNPLEHFPGMGDTFEYYFHIPHTGYMGSGQQYWFHLLVQDCPHHTTTPNANQDWDGGYTIEAIMGSTLRITRRNMDGSIDRHSDDYLTGISWSANTWYKVEVGWTGDTPEATLFEHAGGDSWTTIGTTVTRYSSPWSTGGLGMRGSGDGRVFFDHKRLLP